MSREQIVRDTAYAIWEAEGKPEGRDLAHWRQAEARVAESAAAKAKPEKAKPAKTMPAAKGKAPVSVAKSSAKAAPPDKTATSAKKG